MQWSVENVDLGLGFHLDEKATHVNNRMTQSDISCVVQCPSLPRFSHTLLESESRFVASWWVSLL